jgi:hypothetical protein
MNCCIREFRRIGKLIQAFHDRPLLEVEIADTLFARDVKIDFLARGLFAADVVARGTQNAAVVSPG